MIYLIKRAVSITDYIKIREAEEDLFITPLASPKLQNPTSPSHSTPPAIMATTAAYGSLLHLLPSPSALPRSTSFRSLAPATAAAPVSSDHRHLCGRSNRSSRRSRRAVTVASSTTDDRVELGENPEGIISGEWPENFSLLTYDDLRAYLEPQVLNEKMKPSTVLGEVMSTTIRAATAEQTLEEIEHHFQFVSGLPVVDGELRCVGVISKKDKAKAAHGLKSNVGEVMSSPPITLSPDKTVMDAAILMLKTQIHRIPVLSEEGQVVGMITRTDIFQALEALKV